MSLHCILASNHSTSSRNIPRKGCEVDTDKKEDSDYKHPESLTARAFMEALWLALSQDYLCYSSDRVITENLEDETAIYWELKR